MVDFLTSLSTTGSNSTDLSTAANLVFLTTFFVVDV